MSYTTCINGFVFFTKGSKFTDHQSRIKKLHCLIHVHVIACYNYISRNIKILTVVSCITATGQMVMQHEFNLLTFSVGTFIFDPDSHTAESVRVCDESGGSSGSAR